MLQAFSLHFAPAMQRAQLAARHHEMREVAALQ